MRLVEIIPSLNNSGGAEIMFDSLCSSFAKDKTIELTIICLYDGVSDRFTPLVNNPCIQYYQLGKKLGFDLKCAKKLKKLLKDINPDVVHYHLSVSLTYFLSFGQKKTKWKTFCTVHSLPEMDERKSIQPIRKILGKKGLVKYIGISNIISQKTKELYCINECPVVFNGCSIKEGRTLNGEKNYDFICVAVFKPAKNHKLLFNAFHRLLKEHPTATLLTVGGGELFDSSIEYAKELGIDSQITFAGWQNNVDKYLKQAKYFVLSSIYEGNPISILEALQYGLPVVAPNVGGIPDVITDKENGILYTGSNEDELYKSMKLIYENNELAKIIAHNNFNKAEEFSIDNCAKKYLSIFRGE